jgi:hypothetical protein
MHSRVESLDTTWNKTSQAWYLTLDLVCDTPCPVLWTQPMQGCFQHPPSSISGKPVTSSTFFTGMPQLAMVEAVPPVEMISNPCCARPCRAG